MVRDPAAETIQHERAGSSEQDADVLDDLPPSVKFVRHVLGEQGPLATSEIISETSMSESTVHKALDRLQEDTEGWVRMPDPTDGRRVLWDF